MTWHPSQSDGWTGSGLSVSGISNAPSPASRAARVLKRTIGKSKDYSASEVYRELGNYYTAALYWELLCFGQNKPVKV